MTGFASSGSINSDVAERNRRLRAPLMRRLFVNGWNGGVLGHFLYMVFVMAAVISSVGQAFNTSMPNSTAQEEENVRWIFILTHAGWPPLSWICMNCLSACAVPILNIFQPPSVPEREKLLVRSQDTGVAYPKQDAHAERSSWSTMDYIHELMYTLVTIYTTGIFVASWVK